MDTLFQRIIEGELPADIVYRDELVTAFRDIRPRAPTHILIVPNKLIATANDIAWLKLDVIAHRGSGVLTPVTTVQRINTSGGQLTGACDKAGATKSAPYSADYVFLKKG